MPTATVDMTGLAKIAFPMLAAIGIAALVIGEIIKNLFLGWLKAQDLIKIDFFVSTSKNYFNLALGNP